MFKQKILEKRGYLKLLSIDTEFRTIKPKSLLLKQINERLETFLATTHPERQSSDKPEPISCKLSEPSFFYQATFSHEIFCAEKYGLM